MKSRRLILIAGAALAAATFSQNALAQFYKDKTITMIINYPAGGPTDIEGRIVAQHLPDHIPGKPNVVIKNVGGAGGIIGSNQLGEASPDGYTIGFFTADLLSELIGNPAVRTKFEDFIMLVGVENPLVFYARKDTPPGLKVAADIMKAHDFKALSLNQTSTNTVNQELCLDLLDIKYQPIPAYRGLKDVETAILQGIGQMANTSFPGWYGSVLPTMGDKVLPLWQIAPRAADGSYPRSKALPDMPTFEEFYASVKGGKKPSGISYQALRTVADPLVAMFRAAVMPPKSPSEAVKVLRAALADLWNDKGFIDDYTRVVKTTPVMVSGDRADQIVADLAKVPPEIKTFLTKYTQTTVK
jgi:tripartite-type tricarboxylate transporter receptor subunit TctC